MATQGGTPGEQLTAYVKCVKSIRAIGTVFQKVFLTLGEFLARLVLSKAIAPGLDTGGLDSQEESLVVLTVDIWSEVVASGESVVDQTVLLITVHPCRRNSPTTDSWMSG